MDYKTNVMRIFDKNNIKYGTHTYSSDSAINGMEVAKAINESPEKVFKTLVTIGKSKNNYVFVIPVMAELDLKKAALAVNEKSVEMIKQKDLLPLTGYVHGGCSPVGMKKMFTTVINSSAINFETIIFSAGKIGYQVEISLDELKKVIPFQLTDLI